MFSRLSRYLTRSKRRKPNYKPLPDFPPKLTLDISPAENRPSSASSGHSSSCSIQPDYAPSFLQVVCNDSQPVYCMETVPFYNPSSLPPGTRKANSLYDSAHEEILKERIRVTALESDAERNREERERCMEMEMGGGSRSNSLRRQTRVSGRRCNSMKHPDIERFETQRCNSLQQPTRDRRHGRYGRQSFETREREREAVEYTSLDNYFGPPLYCNPSFSKQPIRSPTSQRSKNSQYHDKRYVEPGYPLCYPQDYFPPPPTRKNLPIPLGPFTQGPPSPAQEHFPISRTIPAEQFIRRSSLRQGPYNDFQHPHSPLSETNYHSNPHYSAVRPHRMEVPRTRVTRLKQAKTFIREEGTSSDIGIGLGHISGMAASRSVSRRTQSDVGVGTRAPISKPLPKVENKENTAPRSTRASPRTPPQVIKIGKPTGRYKTDRMPVYHLTTPDSDDDDESDESRDCFVPLSASALAEITGDRTSKWLEDVLKFTISQPPEQMSEEKSLEPGLGRRNTVDVRRHRVFSTTMEVHPKKQAMVEDKVEVKRTGREGREEAPSSWIASEIFNIASEAEKPKPTRPEELSKKESVQIKIVDDYDGYDEIESLMGDYFEDLKERGSDCGED